MPAPTVQCPAHIEFLIHCHCRPHRVFDRLAAPVFQELVRDWVPRGVIRQSTSGADWFNRYHLTPLGLAWLRAIENVELPRSTFVDAQGKEIKL